MDFSCDFPGFTYFLSGLGCVYQSAFRQGAKPQWVLWEWGNYYRTRTSNHVGRMEEVKVGKWRSNDQRKKHYPVFLEHQYRWTSQSFQGNLRSQARAHLALYTVPQTGSCGRGHRGCCVCVASASVVCSQVSGGGPGVAFGQLEDKNKLPLPTTVSNCNRLLREMTVALICLPNLTQVPLLANFNLEPSRK